MSLLIGAVFRSTAMGYHSKMAAAVSMWPQLKYVIAATGAACDRVAAIIAVCTLARCAIAVSLLLSVM